MPDLTDKCIFFAEDDPDDQALFRQAIYDVSDTVFIKTFDDGVALMDSLYSGAQLPDILFLDLNMPRKSGFDCLIGIKDDARLQKINVVILSTSTHPQNIDYCYNHGAAFYAVKPPDYRTLTKLLKKVVDHDWGSKVGRTEFLLDCNPAFLRQSWP